MALTEPKYTIQDFQLFRVIYSGSLSTVQVVKHIPTNKAFALKKYSKFSLLSKNKTQYLMREKNILDTIRNPFIVSCVASFQDKENLYLMFEYLQGGDLLRLKGVERVFSVKLSQFYLAEILEALGHLHCRNVIYRGLKPENVVLDHEGHIRLVDFGMAKRVQDCERALTLSGTPEYLAPEVVMKIGHREETDFWTLGIMLFEFLTGKLPFYARSPMLLYEKILNSDPNFSKILDKNAEDLCRNLLHKDFQARVKIKQIRKHRFFEDINWRTVAIKGLKPIHVPLVTSPMDSSNFPFFDDVLVSQPFEENVINFPGFD